MRHREQSNDIIEMIVQVFVEQGQQLGSIHRIDQMSFQVQEVEK